VEPCFLVFDVQSTELDQSITDLRAVLSVDTEDLPVVKRCKQKRIERVAAMNKSMDELVSGPMDSTDHDC
jgi:hypothetical protein